MLILKELLRSFKVARYQVVFTFLSYFIGLSLIFLSYLTFRLSNHLEEELLSRFSFVVFLEDGLKKDEAVEVYNNIKKLEIVDQASFIDRDSVLKNLSAQANENFEAFLDGNPIPYSVSASLKKEAAGNYTKDDLNKVISSVKNTGEIVFDQDMLRSILLNLSKVKITVYTLSVILFFITLYLVYATTLLILKNRADEFETMKLVGANITKIKLPFIILNSVLGIAATLLLTYLFSYLAVIISPSAGFNSETILNTKELLAGGIAYSIITSALISLYALRQLNIKFTLN